MMYELDREKEEKILKLFDPSYEGVKGLSLIHLIELHEQKKEG